MNLPILTDPVSFNGGTWYREGKYMIVIRKVGSDAIPAGFKDLVPAAGERKVFEEFGVLKEQVKYMVPGWVAETKIISRPNETLLNAADNTIIQRNFGTAEIRRNKGTLVVEEPISGYLNVNYAFSFSNRMKGVVFVKLILNGTKELYSQARVISDETNVSSGFLTSQTKIDGNFLTGVLTFTPGDLLSVVIEDFDKPDLTLDIVFNNLRIDIINPQGPHIAQPSFYAPKDIAKIKADLTIGDVKLSLEYPSDSNIDLGQIVSAIKGNK